MIVYNNEKKLFEQRDRRRVFNSLDRLEEFEYDDNHLNGPSFEDMERQQKITDELYSEHLVRYRAFNYLLRSAENIHTPKGMADWLEKNLGYQGVNIEGHSKPIPFESALNAGFAKNIEGMFRSELKRLKKEIQKSSRYIF